MWCCVCVRLCVCDLEPVPVRGGGAAVRGHGRGTHVGAVPGGQEVPRDVPVARSEGWVIHVLLQLQTKNTGFSSWHFFGGRGAA
jgi:hypothetical protein